jgi:hypothetical protein
MHALLNEEAQYTQIPQTANDQYFVNDTTKEFFRFYGNVVPGFETKLYMNARNWRATDKLIPEGYRSNKGRKADICEMYLD